jgi:hypothetical protein
MGLDLTQITVKSRESIVEKLSRIIHHHRRRYMKKHTRPCPINCEYASVVSRGVTGCTRCDSSNPEVCRQEAYFAPIASKEEIAREFSLDLRDPNILRHEYRDVMALLKVTART